MKTTLACAGALLAFASQLSGCMQVGAGDDGGSAGAIAVDVMEPVPGPSGSAVAADASANEPLALDHVGEARIGEAFVAADWLQEWVDEGAHPEVDCTHFTGGVLPAGVSMMVMDGRIARFELRDDVATGDAARVRAPFGLHLGMSSSEILARLPEGARTSPHAYSAPEGEYLTWQDPVSGLGVRVETMPDHIDAIFWGDAEAITLIEGCS